MRYKNIHFLTISIFTACLIGITTSSNAYAARKLKACVSKKNGNLIYRIRCKKNEMTVNTSEILAGFNVGISGVQGPQGEKGPTGATGPTGAIGDTGIKGPDGAVGADGPKGLNGPQGVDGDQGVDGAQGATGDPGTEAPPLVVSTTETSLLFNFPIAPTGSGSISASCPSGEVVVGGGCEIDNPSLHLGKTYPGSTTFWTCTWYNVSATTIPTNTATGTARVRCANLP